MPVMFDTAIDRARGELAGHPKRALDLLLPAGPLLGTQAEFNALPDQVGDGGAGGRRKPPESPQLAFCELNLCAQHLLHHDETFVAMMSPG